MKRLLSRILMLVIWLLLLGGGLAAFEAHRFLTTPGSDEPQEIIFSIAPGATFDRVAWDLKKAGVVTDVFRFRLLAKLHDALGKVKAGEYAVNTGWTPEQVLNQITRGQSLLHRLVVREGLTWWETARAVEAQGFARYEDFKAVIHDPDFLREHNIPFANAEGFLYPETYLLKKPPAPDRLDKAQAREIAGIMVRMFWKKTEPLWSRLPLKQGGRAGTAAGAMASPPLTGSPVPAVSTRDVPSQAAAARADARTISFAAQGNTATGAVPGNTVTGAVPGNNGTTAVPGNNGTTAVPGNNGTTAVPGNTVTGAVPGNTVTGAVPGESSAVRDSAPSASVNGPGGGRPEQGADGLRDPAEVDPAALKRLIILASLVEKETAVAAERARVAGVYANRLRLGMLLQCDPTIIYGVGETFTGSIRRSQLEDAGNRYNTYKHSGLPPGPIASSGLESLKAAFLPEKHEYLFFVATGVDGGHTFSKSINEHNKAVEVYRARTRESR